MIINPVIYNPLLQVHNTTYLYYLGDECIATTGGWNGYTQQTATTIADDTQYVTENDDSITIGDTGSSTVYALAATTNAITLEDYVLLYAKFTTDSNSSGTNNLTLDGRSVKATSTSPVFHQLGTSGVGDYEYNIDVSALSNSAYVILASQQAQNTVFCVALAKQDDLSYLSDYGTTIAGIIANASSLFQDQSAVTRMIRYCTGDFMWAALQDAGFVSALEASDFAYLVMQHPEWGKAYALLLLNETDLLYDANGNFLMDKDGNLLYQAQG